MFYRFTNLTCFNHFTSWRSNIYMLLPSLLLKKCYFHTSFFACPIPLIFPNYDFYTILRINDLILLLVLEKNFSPLLLSLTLGVSLSGVTFIMMDRATTVEL